MKVAAQLGWLSVLAVLAATQPAAACDPERPAVAVRFTGQLDEAFQRAVLADLEAGLTRSNLGVCALGAGSPLPAAPALAELSIAVGPQLAIDLAVRVHDGQAESRLDRRLELAQVPADSRAFALALAADELLRATGLEWLGGAEEPAPAASVEPSQPVPAEREGLAGQSAGQVAAGRWSLGLRPALELFGGGQTLWGADAALVLPLAARVELQLAPGLRSGMRVSAPQGQIESSALILQASARYRLIDAGWQLAAGFGLYGARLELQGASSSAGTSASRFAGLALYTQGQLAASLPLAGPLRVELGGALGVPLRQLEATASGRAATAASGLQLGISAALWLQL